MVGSSGWQVLRNENSEQQSSILQTSHLKLLHSDLRNRFADSTVEALMFVRMNARQLGVAL